MAALRIGHKDFDAQCALLQNICRPISVSDAVSAANRVCRAATGKTPFPQEPFMYVPYAARFSSVRFHKVSFPSNLLDLRI